MRVYDQGAFFKVACSADDVSNFNRSWPCSVMDGPISFTFDKKNGDLVDVTPSNVDGPEVVALSQDAQKYGEARLTWTVGFRTGTREDFKWDKTIPFYSKEIAQSKQDELTRGGSLAYVYPTYQLESVGLPESFE